jgi:hypothetical protein
LKPLEEAEWQGRKKWTCKDTFKVVDIQYSDKKIVYVKILNLKTNGEIEFGQPAQAHAEQKKIEKSVISEVKVKALISRCEKEGVPAEKIMRLYKVDSLADITEKQFSNINEHWEEIKKAN